jgi:hypothetical protein
MKTETCYVGPGCADLWSLVVTAEAAYVKSRLANDNQEPLVKSEVHVLSAARQMELSMRMRKLAKAVLCPDNSGAAAANAKMAYKSLLAAAPSSHDERNAISKRIREVKLQGFEARDQGG